MGRFAGKDEQRSFVPKGEGKHVLPTHFTLFIDDNADNFGNCILYSSLITMFSFTVRMNLLVLDPS